MTGKGNGPNRARAVAAEKLARQRAAERRRKALLGGLVAAVVLVAAVIVGVAVYSGQQADTFATPKGGDRAGVTIGNAGAQVTVDVYVDYLCPHCKRFESEAGQTLDKLVSDGTAKVVYHPIAILDDASSSKYSTRAANAAGCAADAGKFAEFTKALFDKQPAEGTAGLSNDELIQLGRDAGVSSSNFNKCVKDGKYTDWTAAITEAASKAGVTGTPTVKVNGKPLSDPTVASLTQAVADATKK
jgi:protein-disulfide isomerase